jgi:hypothetical protein
MKNKKEKNYKPMFYMGIIFMGTGVIFMTSINLAVGAAFLGLGVTYMILGSKNKEKVERKNE